MGQTMGGANFVALVAEAPFISAILVDVAMWCAFSFLPLGAGSFRVVGSAGVHPYEAFAALSALSRSSLLLLAASLLLSLPSPPPLHCLLSPSPRAHL